LALISGLLLNSASAFIVFDNENGEIAFTVRAGIEYDSNIFANRSEVSDTVWVATPKFQFRRDAGLITVDADLGIDTGWYADHPFQDYEDFKSGVTALYANPGGKLDASVTARFDENTQADAVVGNILSYEETQFRASIRYQLLDKIAVRFLPTYVNRTYANPENANEFTRFNDLTRTGMRFDVAYNYSPKLDVIAGYRFRDIDNPGRISVSGASNLLLLGVEGEITPKITGIAEVGFQNRSFDSGRADDSATYFNIGMSYALSDRTSIDLNIEQDYEVAANNLAIDPFSIGLSVSHSWNDKVVTNAGVEWVKYNYTGQDTDRSDDLFIGSVRGQYYLTPRSSLDAGVSWLSRSSDSEFADYSRLRGSLGVNVTF